MKLDRLELLHLRLPLVRPFETSFGRETERETLIVRAEAGGVSGWGESPASATPSYGPETVHTCRHVIRDFIAPALREFAADVTAMKPTDLFKRTDRIRGNPMAKAGVEAALWDLLSRLGNVPLYTFYNMGRPPYRVEVPVGISLGIEETFPELAAQIEKALAAGYQRVKLKIKPGWDVDVVREARRLFPQARLMVDANGAYTPQDIEHLKALDEFNLMMIEQPLAWDDIFDHIIVARALKTPVCLDESIRHAEDARKAITLGACRVVNIKPARVGGPLHAVRVHNACQERGIPVWCGGMLETGVGRAHNVALATLPGFTLPGDISASARYYAEDIVDPPFTVTPAGTIRVPRGPGIGVRVREEMIEKYCVNREVMSFG